jgi:hypothetical protein
VKIPRIKHHRWKLPTEEKQFAGITRVLITMLGNHVVRADVIGLITSSRAEEYLKRLRHFSTSPAHKKPPSTPTDFVISSRRP